MITLDLKSLIKKLNNTTRNALEGAAGLCLSRTHYNVEVEHWLIKLLEVDDSDLQALLKTFDLSPDTLSDRKSTRLNSSHVAISYAGFCLKQQMVHPLQR